MREMYFGEKGAVAQTAFGAKWVFPPNGGNTHFAHFAALSSSAVLNMHTAVVFFLRL